MLGGAVAAAVALATSKPSDTVSAGSGTANITWEPAGAKPYPVVDNPPQPFTGTIEGIPVTGIATSTLSTKDIGSFLNPEATTPAQFQIYRWKGVLGAKPFDLTIAIQEPKRTLAGESPVGSPLFKVTGTYDGQAVNVDVPFPSSAAAANNSAPIGFHGSVGGRSVSGTVLGPAGGNAKQTTSATFTVAG